MHLKYHRIRYVCTHFGNPRSRSEGKRPNQHHFASACKASFSVTLNRLADEGACLEVSDVCLDHNHQLSEANYQFYPKVRRLSALEKEETTKLLRLNVRASDLKETLCESTGKRIQSKHILNIAKGEELRFWVLD